MRERSESSSEGTSRRGEPSESSSERTPRRGEPSESSSERTSRRGEPSESSSERTSRRGRRALLVNATELLRQPGLVRHIEAVVPRADVDAVDDRLGDDIAVFVTLTSTIDDIEVAGTLTVDWADTCRRCLRPLADSLRIHVDERYAEADDTGMRRVDPEAFPIEHGQLDLAPMVREEVLLGVPDAPLCRPDCPGLCPACGADLQVGPCDCANDVRDERWAALDQLRLDD